MHKIFYADRMRQIFWPGEMNRGLKCLRTTIIVRARCPYPQERGGLALTFVMLGLTFFFSASMWTGGALGTGLSFNDFFLAVLIGNLLLGIYTAFLGFIGSKTGLTTHLLARYSFGIKGSLASLIFTRWYTSRLVWCRCCDVCYSRW